MTCPFPYTLLCGFGLFFIANVGRTAFQLCCKIGGLHGDMNWLARLFSEPDVAFLGAAATNRPLPMNRHSFLRPSLDIPTQARSRNRRFVASLSASRFESRYASPASAGSDDEGRDAAGDVLLRDIDRHSSRAGSGMACGHRELGGNSRVRRSRKCWRCAKCREPPGIKIFSSCSLLQSLWAWTFKEQAPAHERLRWNPHSLRCWY